jgi:hypothetical protein
MVREINIFLINKILRFRPISSRDFALGDKCLHCGKLAFVKAAKADDPLNLSDMARTLQEKFRDLVSTTSDGSA